MRKYGKFEKKAKAAPQPVSPFNREAFRKKELKNALLQTYFTSLMSLVLCVSLFFGTSYAWFTSEVTNATNEIHVGKLDVDLYKVTDGQKIDLSTENTKDAKYKLFNPDTVWNPGYTMLETVRIENNGNLDFKYVMSFTEGKLVTTGTRSMEVIANYFDIWTYDHENDPPAPDPKSYTDISEKNGWVKVGTLKDVLAGTALVTGDMGCEKVNGANPSHTYTIAIHMNEGAGPELMGQTLSLNVKLVAYQKVDAGDLTSTQTDIAPVSNVAELKTAAAAGKSIILSRQVDVKIAEDRIVMNGGVLDGADNKITYSGSKVDAEGKPVGPETTGSTYSAGVVTTNGGVVSNLLIEAGSNGRALYVTDLASDLTVSNCNFNGAYAFNVNSAKVTDHVIRFTSCYLRSWTSYANVAARVDFVDCEFQDVLKPYGDTVLSNCNFTGTNAEQGLDITGLERGERVTLLNCTYKGKTIEKAVVIRDENGAVTITGTKLLEINGENPLRLVNNG